MRWVSSNKDVVKVEDTLLRWWAPHGHSVAQNWQLGDQGPLIWIEVNEQGRSQPL